jgi:hypothetical protein
MKRLTLFLAAIAFVSFLSVFLSNAQETITLSDGAKYVGEMKDGKPNGEGTITFRKCVHNASLWSSAI